MVKLIKSSNECEIKETQNKIYFRKKKSHTYKNLNELFGFNEDEINDLSRDEYNFFLELKEQIMPELLNEMQIFVTTAEKASTRAMSDLKF